MLKNLFAKACGDERNALILVGEQPKAFSDFARLKESFPGRLEFIVKN